MGRRVALPKKLAAPLKFSSNSADCAEMFTKKLLAAARFLTGPVLALLQFWVLWGVCNSYALMFARVGRAELTMSEILPQMAKPTALTALFLLLAGMLWSWATRMQGFQAAIWFVAFAVMATFSPLLVLKGLDGQLASLEPAIAIRIVLTILIAAAFYLGSNMFSRVSRKLAPSH